MRRGANQETRLGNDRKKGLTLFIFRIGAASKKPELPTIKTLLFPNNAYGILPINAPNQGIREV